MIAMPVLVAGLIALAVVIAAVRILRSGHRWRWPLAFGQLLAGVLLYVFLFPPPVTEVGGNLTILTPGISSEQLAGVGTGADVIALPGIAIRVDGRIERAPDLATALRRHPETSRLRVVSAGVAATAAVAAWALPLRLNILVAIASAVAICLVIEHTRTSEPGHAGH